jgi:PAS domain S-box-containing protein
MSRTTHHLDERIVETIHEPLLVLDADFRVRRANPSFCRTFRVSEADALGTPLFDLGDGHWDIPELRTRLREVRDGDDSIEGLEIDRDFPGLGRRVMRLNCRRLPAEGGDAGPLLLAIDDVTEERDLEEELRRNARELERSNAELEQFAYAASHDLQEPLRMVASYLELLDRRYGEELEDEAREFIEYAVDGARRMKALINGLLAYSRVGRKEGDFGVVDLDSVVDAVLDDLAGHVEETGAEIRRDPLPKAYGNEDQLRRVFQNLVENALTHHGDAPPRIRITGGNRSDGGVEVAVSDRGPGIPPGVDEKVFQLFHQLDPHGAGREGSGMGLAISRKIVERHGGTIGVTSTPGEGATFRFTLDLDPEETS